MIKSILVSLLALSLVQSVTAAEAASEKKKTGILSLLKKGEKDPKPSASEAEAITKSLTPSQKTKLMDIVNKGDDAALTSLPGIGATRAAAIKKARPVAGPEDLIKVEGIGESTLKGMVDHAKAGFPAATTSEKAAPKKEASKSAEKKESSKGEAKAPAKSSGKAKAKGEETAKKKTSKE
jgi:DNA uptake protein ComE-like DNA-binding protein